MDSPAIALALSGHRENCERRRPCLHLATQGFQLSSLQGNGPQEHLVLFPHDVLDVQERPLGRILAQRDLILARPGRTLGVLQRG